MERRRRRRRRRRIFQSVVRASTCASVTTRRCFLQRRCKTVRFKYGTSATTAARCCVIATFTTPACTVLDGIRPFRGNSLRAVVTSRSRYGTNAPELVATACSSIAGARRRGSGTQMYPSLHCCAMEKARVRLTLSCDARFLKCYCSCANDAGLECVPTEA